MVYGIIMAGGKGTRFWPEGRTRLPKQLLKLTGDRTMIEVAVARLAPLIPPERQLIVTTGDYAGLIAETLPDFPAVNILAETEGKNTAACVGWGAVHALHRDPNAVIAVVTADHAIKNEAAFLSVLGAAISVAESNDTIVTIGLVPTRADTGFGYIQFGGISFEPEGHTVHEVVKFHEKPDAETAESYVRSGEYLWNSGMFIMRAQHALSMFERHLPEHYAQLEAISRSIGTPDEAVVTARAYDAMQAVSIDYGIMEKAESVHVVPGDFGWSDVGVWSSLDHFAVADDDGNIVTGDHTGIDTTNSIVRSSGRLIATIGVDNLVIVETEDAVLICRKDESQRVREIVEHLEKSGRSDVL